MRPGRTSLVVLGLLAACQHVPFSVPHVAKEQWSEARFAHKTYPRFDVKLKDGAPVDTVVGTTTTYRVRDGDTLLDVARWFDLGYNEIVEANPGLDPWLPPVGSTLKVPTAWVLPCCTYEGLVVNIPEMRLFLYRRKPDDASRVTVETYPVGLGRDDRRTPRGRFTVRGKTVDPQWNIPESIRQEHIRERGDARTFIRGGDPDNPLGKYRFELTLPRYAIHGTNIPWGVGMQVSHGCARLYPEDMERLFPAVSVGTRGEFTYQPVKVGRRKGAVYVEVHPDIYGYSPKRERAAQVALRRLGDDGHVDQALLRTALAESQGTPYRVSRDGRLPLRP